MDDGGRRRNCGGLLLGGYWLWRIPVVQYLARGKILKADPPAVAFRRLIAIAACISLLIGGSACWPQDQRDILGLEGPFHIPVDVPSFDQTPKVIVLENQTYRIPRNYIFSIDNIRPGTMSLVSMRALLPGMIGISKDNANCFLDLRQPCHAQVVLIGLSRGNYPTTGEQQLKNIRPISQPGERIGPCDLKYYQSLGSDAAGGVVFQYFFKKHPNDMDLSVARCPTEKSAFASRCNSNANLSDGNSFYYIFDRSKLCEWANIRTQISDFIASTQSQDRHE